MLVSVIIPSFRQPQFLGRAIESALEQDYSDIEVLIVDDTSLDSSLAVAVDAMQRDPRIRVLARRVNGGLGRARNTGLMAARGKLVTFLDSDDYLLPGSITARVEVWMSLSDEERAEVTGVYGDWQHVGEDVDEPQSVRAPRSGLATLSAENYAGENLFICSSPLLRPEPLKDVGGFAEDVPMLEDFAAWARLLAAGGSFVPAEAVVCTYRQRPTSMLRGKASTLMSMVDEINEWLGGNGVTIDGQRGGLSALAGNGPSRSARRTNWLRAGSFGKASGLITGHRQLRTGTSNTAVGFERGSADFMNRTRAHLDTALDDVDEFDHTAVGPARRRTITQRETMPRVLFAPSTLEESLDALALTAALRSVDYSAGVVMSHPRQTDERWPLLLADTPRISVDAVDDGTEYMVLFGDGGPIRQAAITRFNRTQLVHRASGLDALNVYARGAARRYRNGETVMVRSHLEAAELGDRRAVVVPSGVGVAAELIWGERNPNDEVILLVPPSLTNSPWIHMWVHTALSALQRSAQPLRMMAAPSVAQAADDLRAEPINLQAIRDAHTVVTPLDGTAVLVEALGTNALVFDPIQNPDAVSAAWRRGKAFVATADALLEAITAERPSTGLEDLVAIQRARDLGSLGDAAIAAIFGER